MQRVYANRINWENEPSQNTPINENNLNKMDYALFTIDGRVCDQDLTKANQSDLLLSVKRVDYDTTTGVFTFEWQNGTIKTIDLNIEKIPVSFSLDADGVIRMKTADGTVFTADISQTLKQYNFVDSSVIDFTESVDTSGNKTITANIIDGSITAEKLQPNFLADCTEAKETAETKALVSEGYAVGEQNGVPVDETSPYYHNNAKYFSDKSASTIYQQSNWNETDQTQSAYIHNKPFNSLDQNDFEVVNGILKTKAQAIDSLNDITDVNVTSAINGEVLTYENNKWINKKSSGGLLPRLVITTEAGAIVTAEKDGTILSVTNNEIDIPEFGTWVVKSFINGEYAIVNVVVDSVKIYNVNAMHFSATINVTAPNGSIITISNGTETYTKESAPYSFDVRISGNWSIECQLEDAIKVASVIIEHNGDVKTASFSFAKIIVNYEAEFAGKVITATDGTRTYTRTANGVVSFVIANYGTWTISAVVDGETYETEVNINSDTEYTVELIYKKGFEYTEWLRLAGISQSYASLDDVLADEKAVRTLMTKHASVDYLASFENADENIVKTINNDICAKWINLRDYAIDTLYANEIIKGYMDTADKYFYGDWVEKDGTWQAKGNVPVMTSNTAPYGEAIQISNYGDNYAWKAFNENNSNFWESGAMSGDNRAWLGYKFVNPICVKMVTMASSSTDAQYFPRRYKVQGSNDGSAWEDISPELTNANNTPNVKHTNTFDNDKYYSHIRVIDVETFGTHQFLQMNYLQFYGRELKVSIPAMTSSNAPWGEASGADTPSDSYKAFDNADDTYIRTSAVYNFKNPVIVKMASIKSYTASKRIDNFDILGSNDNLNWDTLGHYDYPTLTLQTEAINNNSEYRYYKAIAYSSAGPIISTLQFYGLDYSEHNDRHYIYDHEVEVEEVVKSTTSVLATVDTTNYTLLRATTGKYAISTDRIKCGSATSVLNGMPYNSYLNIASVNGENETGFSSVVNTSDISCWLE